MSGDYIFIYDDLSRLTSANSTTMANVWGANFEYDKQGNITKLTHNGRPKMQPAGVDNLTFSYTGNQPTGAVFNKNGSMTKDPSSSLTNVQYNFLDLPRTVTHSTGTNTYLYTADGVKRQMSTTKSGTPVTDYAGNKIYEGGFFENAFG